MHQSVMDWVLAKKHQYGLDGPLHILEVGSYNVNGSVRTLFDQTNYLGVDIEEGPGVDMVVSSHELHEQPWLGSTFDLVVSTEMLEHDRRPWESLSQMHWVLKAGGLLLVTARGNGFGDHNPPDRFRFMEQGFHDIIEDAGFEVLEVTADPQAQGWFGVGRK